MVSWQAVSLETHLSSVVDSLPEVATVAVHPFQPDCTDCCIFRSKFQFVIRVMFIFMAEFEDMYIHVRVWASFIFLFRVL